MKMQIWKIYIADGVADLTRGWTHPIYEACVPELRFVINHLTSFVGNESDLFKRYTQIFQDSPKPELICEVELSRTQIEDVKQLASKDNPENRMKRLISDILVEKELDTVGYKDISDE